MNNIKLAIYGLSVALIGLAIVLSLPRFYPSLALFIFAMVQFVYLGWDNVWRAVRMGIYVSDDEEDTPTENMP